MAFPSTTGTLNFYVSPKDGARAYQTVNAKIETGTRDRNFTLEGHDIEIHNLRGNESAATLDTTGFQLLSHPAKHTSFANDAEIEKEYYPESIEFIKKFTGASRVVLFDHSASPSQPFDAVGRVKWIRPQTGASRFLMSTSTKPPKSAVARVHRHLPAEDVPELLKHRFQIINLWRPISNPADDTPLALCDFRSMDPEADVLAVALVYPDREGETYGVKYNPKQRWTYFSGVKPEELVLIKCYDSVQDGSVALFTPHTAFSDPKTPEGAPLRESIELRFLVFYD
ncbi:hypothetical protein MSAN_00204600 [Mycena sanguinolenta]|uniref:Methyltransferase n=1 Tax=Mycena sanguinolenta TaxID=230812 RepID=A0A8H6ZK14_9AGAR|nr:hypothetical protein MSAN_00204600 [Mycena sanguinolenta]